MSEIPPLPERPQFLKAILGIVTLTFLTYLASLGNSFFLLDDGLLIFENNAIREISFETLRAIFTSYDPELYIPLTLFSYQIDYLIGGYHPMIYHFTNLLLHIFNALLVTWIAFLLSKKKTVALFCGVFFAIHPLHTEAVAWASARKDLLSAFFFFSAIVSYLYYRGGSSLIANRSPLLNRLYFISIASFLLGLLAKVTILTLPAILLLIDFFQKRKWNAKALLDKIPYFALTIIFGIVALGGKAELVDPTNVFEKKLLAIKSTIFYLKQLLFPTGLTPFYPQITPISLVSSEFLIPVLLFLLITLACFAPAALRTKMKIGLPQRTTIFCALFFFITLAPHFITVAKGGNVYFASDRYAYLPSFAFLFLLGTWIFESKLLERLSVTQWRRITAAGIVAALFVVLTFNQSLLWGKNGRDMFAKATNEFPDFYLPYISLGVTERLARRPQQALEALQTAVSLYEFANTYGAIGQIYAEQGDIDRAMEEFEKGLAIDPNDPELHYGLGQLHALQGRTNAALTSYEKSISLMNIDRSPYQRLSRRIASRRDMAYMRIGILYGEQGDHTKAMEYYEEALTHNPFNADVHFNIGIAHGLTGKMEQSIESYEKAIELNPYHVPANINLGILLFEKGKLEEAKEHFETVLEADPSNSTAKEGLGRTKQLLR